MSINKVECISADNIDGLKFTVTTEGMGIKQFRELIRYKGTILLEPYIYYSLLPSERAGFRVLKETK